VAISLELNDTNQRPELMEAARSLGHWRREKEDLTGQKRNIKARRLGPLAAHVLAYDI
jgi:hypothetical protein